MKNTLFILILFLQIIVSCNGQSNGTYCADVDRYNPKTGTESTYRLTVGVENQKVVRLNWPNGGHSDSKDFAPVRISNNKVLFRTYDGVQFRIQLLKKGTDCFNSVSKSVQCSATTKSGARCRNKTDNESGKCWVHKN